jgi:hypothetical protein
METRDTLGGNGEEETKISSCEIKKKVLKRILEA